MIFAQVDGVAFLAHDGSGIACIGAVEFHGSNKENGGSAAGLRLDLLEVFLVALLVSIFVFHVGS